ncbi:unnamed protein product [Callosobruchus maculatus]|uniref:Uncharacterized protein n=1 Tax=Callosobruchus maculatus TaxID=64391 RepID=A0A653BWQ8_CALMS|nr:unnamed protein product [Callosobruchus maculatus]
MYSSGLHCFSANECKVRKYANNLNFIMDLVDESVEKETKNYQCIEDYLAEQREGDICGLGVIHFNIRSLQRHYDELLVYVQSAKEILNVIVLSETGKIENLHDFQIPGYNIYYNESCHNKCDGTLIYIKTCISANVKITNVDNYKFLRVTLFENGIKIGISAIYRSPSMDVDDYINSLDEYLNDLKTEDMEIYLGDINIDLLKQDNKENKYLKEILTEKDNLICQITSENRRLQEQYELITSNIAPKDSIVDTLDSVVKRLDHLEEKGCNRILMIMTGCWDQLGISNRILNVLYKTYGMLLESTFTLFTLSLSIGVKYVFHDSRKLNGHLQFLLVYIFCLWKMALAHSVRIKDLVGEIPVIEETFFGDEKTEAVHLKVSSYNHKIFTFLGVAGFCTILPFVVLEALSFKEMKARQELVFSGYFPSYILDNCFGVVFVYQVWNGTLAAIYISCFDTLFNGLPIFIFLRLKVLGKKFERFEELCQMQNPKIVLRSLVIEHLDIIRSLVEVSRGLEDIENGNGNGGGWKNRILHKLGELLKTHVLKLD